MLIYKFDIIAKLKEQGYTTYQIRKEKIFSESTLQKFRQKQMISAENLDTLCRVFNMQPGEIIEYIPDDEAKILDDNKYQNEQAMMETEKIANFSLPVGAPFGVPCSSVNFKCHSEPG